MSLALLFHYLMLNMFRMLIHPSSGACDLFVGLFHGLYCSGSMCVGVTLWFGWGGVVSGGNTTHEITQQISRKLLKMDVLTSETCWALNNDIKKQVTSSWSLFILLKRFLFIKFVPLRYILLKLTHVMLSTTTNVLTRLITFIVFDGITCVNFSITVR